MNRKFPLPVAMLLATSIFTVAACASEDMATPMNPAGTAAARPDRTAEVLTCVQLKNCRRDCGDNAACKATCDEKATPTIKGTFNAVELCVMFNACHDQTCIEQKCGEQLRACALEAPTPVPGLELTCRDLKNCRLDCHDDACSNACDARAGTAAKAAYAAALACAKTNACTDDQCLNTHCKDVVEACLGK